MPYKLSGNKVIKSDSGEVVKEHPTREKALKHLRALKANVEEAVLCECGAPVRGPVCQRGHRLDEAWSPEARAAAAAARREKRMASMPEGLQWNQRKRALEGKYNGVPLERGVAYQGELAGGHVFTGHWTGEKDHDGEPIFRHVESGERRTFRSGKFYGRLADVASQMSGKPPPGPVTGSFKPRPPTALRLRGQ